MATTAGKGAREKRTVKRVTRKRTTAAAAAATPDPVAEEIILRPAEVPTTATSAFLRGSVRHSDVTDFLRQLIMLLEAGTPILKALKTLSARGQRMAARALIADIAAYVEQGNPLWQAFDRHPKYFSSVFVNLIRASEASGTLVVVLRRSVEYRERLQLLRKRVRGAMVYPAILVFACFLVLTLISMVVIPEFKKLFENADIADKITPLTQFVFAASDWFMYSLPIIVVVVALLIGAYKLWVRNPLARLRADRIKLHLPVVGKIIRKNAHSELTRTMALLLRSGLSMMASLELTRNAINNRAVAHVLQAVRDSVERGEGLEPPLRENEDVIYPVVTDMIVTGEESGRVDLICEQIADVYEEEVQIHINTLGESLQPIFTIIIGVVVVTLFLALFWPLLSMIEELSGSSGV